MVSICYQVEIIQTHFYYFQAANEVNMGIDRHLLLDPIDTLADINSFKCENVKSRVQELLNIKGNLFRKF